MAINSLKNASLLWKFCLESRMGGYYEYSAEISSLDYYFKPNHNK